MQSIAPLTLWLAFLAFIAFMLVLDLGVFHRKAHRVGFREAVTWSIAWVILAALFNLGLYFFFGPDRAMEFASGFLIEKALAIDNMFVFSMIFAAFSVPAAHQHRVLFWGIIGAVVLRAVMICVGGALLHSFHWTMYAFGALLLFTGVKFLTEKHEATRPAESVWFRVLARVLPVSNRYDGGRFFSRENGRLVATPLFLALVAVEFSDVIFAVDSIPAIFAVTSDPFIVFTSNLFAILGLRSMYFVLVNLLDDLPYMKIGLSTVLVYVGLKMLLADVFAIPAGISLGVIALILGVTALASIVLPPPSSSSASQAD